MGEVDQAVVAELTAQAAVVKKLTRTLRNAKEDLRHETRKLNRLVEENGEAAQAAGVEAIVAKKKAPAEG